MWSAADPESTGCTRKEKKYDGTSGEVDFIGQILPNSCRIDIL